MTGDDDSDFEANLLRAIGQTQAVNEILADRFESALESAFESQISADCGRHAINVLLGIVRPPHWQADGFGEHAFSAQQMQAESRRLASFSGST